MYIYKRKTKLAFQFLLLTVCYCQVNAQITYTTLINGAWNNPAVWSTDGITPCACTPGYILSNTNIVINHTSTLSTDLNIGLDATVEISTLGIINGSTRDVVVENGGYIETFGPINVASIEIELGGDGIFHDVVTCVDKFRVEGHAQIDTLVTVLDGDIEVKETGVLDILVPYIEVDVPNGEFKVDGTLNMNNTCLYILNGDFRNKITGTINGSQYIEVMNGEIRDEGVWPASVSWCASGLATTMPFAENCGGCNLLLPIEITDFTATMQNQLIALSWEIPNKLPTPHFDIYRLVETNTNWEKIASVINSSLQTVFYFYDASEQPGYHYYQLGFFDESGVYHKSEIISIMNPLQNKIIYGYYTLSGNMITMNYNQLPFGIFIESSNMGNTLVIIK